MGDAAGRSLTRFSVAPSHYSHPPVKPARCRPETMYGQRRMRFQINPVR